MKKAVEILKDIFLSFGIVIMIFSILPFFVNDKAKDISLFFSYGKQALSFNLIFQFMLLSVITNLLKAFFNSDFMISKMSRILRHIILFILIFIVLIGMILIFNWFDKNTKLPWILTTIAFIISFVLSTVITEVKQQKENEELQNALNKLK